MGGRAKHVSLLCIFFVQRIANWLLFLYGKAQADCLADGSQKVCGLLCRAWLECKLVMLLRQLCSTACGGVLAFEIHTFVAR